MIVGVDWIQFFIRKLPGIRDAVYVDVQESQENPNHQARMRIIRVPQGFAQLIRLALDLYNTFLRFDLFLINDDPVRRRKEVAQVRIRRPDGITKKVKLREPRHRFSLKWPDIRFNPFLQCFSHKSLHTNNLQNRPSLNDDTPCTAQALASNPTNLPANLNGNRGSYGYGQARRWEEPSAQGTVAATGAGFAGAGAVGAAAALAFASASALALASAFVFSAASRASTSAASFGWILR